MTLQLIDSHCHFDEDSFDSDREAVYRRARASGVTVQIVPAVSAALWPKLKAVVAAWPGLYPAYGLHPMCLDEHRPEQVNTLADWLERERPVAIGECGLDYYIPGLDPALQAEYFTAQLHLARAYRLPLIVHARRAVDHVIKYIRRYPGVRGVVHSFSGSEQQAKRLLDLGFLLGFGGASSFPRAHRLHRLLQVLPLEGVLLETDAPYQPGLPHQGERNESAFLVETLAVIAALRDQDPAEIAAITTRNALTLFGIAPCHILSHAPKS